MPAAEFRVTDEDGAYLCVAHSLIFEGSVLVYDPARDEVEWVPARGLPTILAGWKREWQSHWQILCPTPAKKQTASQSSRHATWPGLMTAPLKRRVRKCRRRMTHVRKCRRRMTCTRKRRRKMTCTRRRRRRMSVYPHPTWRIMSMGRWRDEGTQTPKHCLAMRCEVGVRPNQRESGEDGRGSGRPLWTMSSPLPLTIHGLTLTIPPYARLWQRTSLKFTCQIWSCRCCEQVGQEGHPIVCNFASKTGRPLCK